MTTNETAPETVTISTFAEYQREAARTGGDDLLPGEWTNGMHCAALGLCGEAGEVADLLKKHMHHGAPLDHAKLAKELGDALWYIAHACNVMRWDLDKIAALNVKKLRARYPDGFNTADSIAKRDEAATLVVGDGHGHDADTGVTHGTAEAAQ